MTIKAAFEQYLRSLVALRELVADRITFGDRRPREGLPALTWFRSGGASVQNSLGPASMGIQKYQIECWGRTGEEAEAVAQAVKGTADVPALDAFRSALMGGPAGVWVAAARVDDLADDRTPPAFSEQRSDHRVTLEVTLWFDE